MQTYAQNEPLFPDTFFIYKIIIFHLCSVAIIISC